MTEPHHDKPALGPLDTQRLARLERLVAANGGKEWQTFQALLYAAGYKIRPEGIGPR